MDSYDDITSGPPIMLVEILVALSLEEDRSGTKRRSSNLHVTLIYLIDAAQRH
jgi:hypothetical protein